MITTPLCINCICLPMCLNKSTVAIIETCSFFKNTLMNISASISKGDSVSIYFRDLDREALVKISDADISGVYVEVDHKVRHILYWR